MVFRIIIKTYKTVEIDLTTASNYYKEYNNILQAINIFKNIDAFCISYKLLEGCSLCTPAKEKTKFLNPSILISQNDLNINNNLDIIIKNRLVNFQSACSKCGYDKEDRILQNAYFKIYSNIKLPIFFFINFEFSNQNDSLSSNYLEQKIKEFNIRIKYNKEIIHYILNINELFGNKYKLIGIICKPKSNHYNGIIKDYD